MNSEFKLTLGILDSIGEGLFTVDKNFRINFFNRAAEIITGYKREHVMGKFCKHVFKTDCCFEGCPIAQVLEKGENLFDFETEIKNRSGKLINIKLNASILYDDHNEPNGGIVSFRDLTHLEILKRKLIKDCDFHGMIGPSKSMQEIFMLIEEISDTDTTILLQGESGTGKEMVADAIQITSQRRDKPYVKVNCAVFPEQLLASELFGHVKGAFTGAVKDRIGRFELANHGTLFLDEVAEMSPQMQLQLLRVIQEGTFERIGESVTRKVDVRVIAATNKNLQKSIAQGKFREDLYYRLNVIPISIPPLRDRPEDTSHLIRYFVKKFSILYKKDIMEIEPDAMEMLLRYSWPGNVRELENAIEYAFVRTKGKDTIKNEKLPPQIHTSIPSEKRVSKTMKKVDQRARLLEALEKHRWNKTKVAKELGIGRTTLWRLLKEID